MSSTYANPYSTSNGSINAVPPFDSIKTHEFGIAGYTQLGWYPYYEFFAEGVGALGGGNVSIKAGGAISNLLAVLPTNARDAGSKLSSNVYSSSVKSGLIDAAGRETYGSGLYGQGGGSLTLTAKGDITGLNSYVQYGQTSLRSFGSVTPNAIVTGTGDVSVVAAGSITLNDYVPKDVHAPFNVSGLSIAQNSSMLGSLFSTESYATAVFDRYGPSLNFATVDTLQGIATSNATGQVDLNAVGSITLSLQNASNLRASTNRSGRPINLAYNPIQGILPAQIHAISLQGGIVNNGQFITWPDPFGTVDLLARGSVALNKGFTVSDADPAIMPTLAAYANVWADYSENTYLKAWAPSGVPSNPLQSSYYYRNLSDFYLSQNKPLVFRFGGNAFVAGADADQSVLNAEGNLFALPGQSVDLTPAVRKLAHKTGLHANDSAPIRVYAMNGDVIQAYDNGGSSGLDSTKGQAEVFSKPATVYAARDIVNLVALGQNNTSTDVTSILAGRDVVYPTPRNGSGILFGRNGFAENDTIASRAVTLSGPGDLFVASGRDINLGFSSGITTIGNTLNPSLLSQGANVTMLTGLGTSAINYGRFTADFVNPATKVALSEPLQVVDAGGNALSLDAAAFLNGFPGTTRELLINRVFFDLIRDSARNHTGAALGGSYQKGYLAVDTVPTASDGDLNYQRAYAAIGSFLKGTSCSGSFEGIFSQVRTKAGGDINVLAPYGHINIGAATETPGFSYTGARAAQLGVVTEQGGAIRMYADGNIAVNQSRIFTLNGGDLTLVSKVGDIDAGKGAKTVQSIQPPTVAYDIDGNVIITPIGAASGSGIATLRTLPETPVGNADLIAFAGTVDAGDAGVRVSGNLNVAALRVLNADNIQVSGVATGVPAAQAPNIGGLLQAGDTAAANKAEAPKTEARAKPSIIFVEILGFGGDTNEQPCPDDRPV